MARPPRGEVFSPDEIAIVHVMNRVVRRCFLMGDDPLTGKNYDYRKHWIESQLERLAAGFGIDLLCFAILSNHFHLVLRSRPDVVRTWNNTEIARRWLWICPRRKHKDGSPKEPSEPELNSIRNDAAKVKEIRRRLSDISWWMRLLCQRIAQRANAEEEATQGKFWQNRFRSVRLLDEQALLACAAYVDLNPIRAAMAETLEDSHHTSARRRVQTLAARCGAEVGSPQRSLHENRDSSRRHADRMLSPVKIDELHDALGPCASNSGGRCSDKGFLSMSTADYLQLLDWTARQVAPGKPGRTPEDVPPILERLRIQPSVWCELVNNFGELFSLVAGRPQTVDSHRSRLCGRRFHLRRTTRQMLTA